MNLGLIGMEGTIQAPSIMALLQTDLLIFSKYH